MAGINTSPLAARWAGLRQAASAAWAARQPRERLMVGLAVTVLGLFLLWSLGIAPAWRSLRTAPARLEQLEAQLQQMQRLAAEVKELRATPPLPLEQSQAVLTAAAGRLGERARLTLQGSRATLAITGLPADELSAWLAEVRSAGRARVLEAQLSRTPQGLYSGSVVLGLGGGS